VASALGGEGLFWVFEHPEMSGKNMTSITKGSKLSFLTKKLLSRDAFYMVENVPKPDPTRGAYSFPPDLS